MRLEISNYIPHKTPVRPNYNKWMLSYSEELNELYSRLIDIMKNRYPDVQIDWNSKVLFFNFCFWVFKRSSKYIRK